MEDLKVLKDYLKASNADGTHILEATATWCSQCKAIQPFVDKMIAKYPDAKFYTYDTDTAPDIAHELGANSMPTFHIFKDGDMMGSVTGAKAQALEKAISSNYDGKVVEAPSE
ncbi:hypothetical protein DOTSEDRAFT_68396 [Dothistroma septosporum NZE10]|uniref:Thioredoxin domain-containing protein n=1 Tax=Dothistroma septosporum (strain NZE10 / CBS 128990) TaxID=675120 RepID=N1Q2Z4_DOTSN|nr:hypothetical protein DOTSEDRAFT_68396 [Dothistroma septosporum NZE10]